MKFRCVVLSIFCFTLFAVAQTQAEFAPGQAIVRFDKPTTLEQAKSQIDPSLFTVDRVLVKKLDIYLVKFDENLAVPQAVEMLKTYPQLRWAQADHYLKERLTPNDGSFSSQWNMNQTSDADIDAPEAWNTTTGGTDFGGDNIVVAVVDGGCQLTHPDISPNLWVNALESSGTTGVDDDGNGYIDDRNGWNAYDNSGTIPSDGHGTHVSGIVGAKGNNSSMVCGVNWNVKLMEVAGSSTTTSVISIAYGYVLDQKTLWWSSGGTQGANVVSTNSSFGVDLAHCESGTYPVWNDLYTAMGEVGILSACATANANYNVDTQGDVPTSCSSPYMVSVTNTTSTDGRNSGCGYGATTIDLGAPGTNVLSTYPTSTTSSLTGTSMSTPHVAGAIALMHAAASQSFYTFYQLYPDSGALVLKQMLLDATDPISALNGITVTGGRLNLNNAVLAISQYTHPGFEGPYLRYLSYSLDDAPSGNNDGRFNSDETVNLIVTIDNQGVDATNVIGTLSSSIPEITVINGSFSFGDMNSLATVNNSTTPFVIRSSVDVPVDFEAVLSLTLTADGDYEAVRAVTIAVNPKVIHWQDDIESGENGWTHVNVNASFTDQWHISTTRSLSATHSWKCGSATTGNYANLLDAGLVSPQILLPPSAELVFSHWLAAEASGLYPDSAYDGGIVEISANGIDFTQIAPIDGYTHHYRRPTTGPLPGAACLSNSANWPQLTFDLAAYEGQTVQFRFRFSSDGGAGLEGWYIDDVLIMGKDIPVPDPEPATELLIWSNGNNIELSWTPPDEGSYKYRVYRSLDNSIVPAEMTLLGTTTTPSFTDVDAVSTINFATYIVVVKNP